MHPAGRSPPARAAARPAAAPGPAAAEPRPDASGTDAAPSPTAPAPRPSAAGRAKVGSAVTAEPAPPVAAAPAAAVAAPAPEVPAPAAAGDQVASAAPAAGDGPSRDELTLVWADQVLPHLSARAKPVLAAGHWIDTDGGVALAVPNEPHRARSEQHRAELEAALAAHFGRPVPVTFVLEPSTPARPRGAGERGARAAPDPEPEEAIDPAELVDAGPEHDLAPLRAGHPGLPRGRAHGRGLRWPRPTRRPCRR